MCIPPWAESKIMFGSSPVRVDLCFVYSKHVWMHLIFVKVCHLMCLINIRFTVCIQITQLRLMCRKFSMRTVFQMLTKVFAPFFYAVVLFLFHSFHVTPFLHLHLTCWKATHLAIIADTLLHWLSAVARSLPGNLEHASQNPPLSLCFLHWNAAFSEYLVWFTYQ